MAHRLSRRQLPAAPALALVPPSETFARQATPCPLHTTPLTFHRNDPVFRLGGTAHVDQIASVNSWRAVISTLRWRFRDPGSDLA